MKPLMVNTILANKIKSLFKTSKQSMESLFCELPQDFQKLLLHGSASTSKVTFPGIINILNNYVESHYLPSLVTLFLSNKTCPTCNGTRLKKYPQGFKYKEKSFFDICELPLNEALDFFSQNIYTSKSSILKEVEKKLLHQIKERLAFLVDVGLEYLNLNRSADTLSGGELQRIRLASQLGTKLSGVIYILDEPSIGLHQRDNQKLIQSLIKLKNAGNTVIVVEHDEETMRNADFLIEIGPEAGEAGGYLVSCDLPENLKTTSGPTMDYLFGGKKIIPKTKTRTPEIFFTLENANTHNLKNVTVKFPLNVLCTLTGVSGSGKSSLVHDELVPHLKKFLDKQESHILYSGNAKDFIHSLIIIDQKPIGRSPKSIPVTYCGIFDLMRLLFSNTEQAKVHGYSPSNFSFNVKGGRCETCQGNGVVFHEVAYLSESAIVCASCQGRRYSEKILAVKYRGLSIDDVLNLSIQKALEFFKHHRKIAHTLKTLMDVGLGYIKLGQASTTLSGGEAQRIKLSKELSKFKRGKTLYLLDEPTTGLHFKDIELLLNCLNNLVDQGNSVVVIEHNMDLIKCSDYIIDLGPGGGVNGGQVVAFGSPESISKNKKSITGQFINW
jgi:excinuclease ABC subunit A